MVKREQFINKLHELKYKFKKECDRTSLWKRGVHRLFLPRTALLSEEWVRQTLAQCDVKQPDIDAFIRSANS
jgi:hypothetical protein